MSKNWRFAFIHPTCLSCCMLAAVSVLFTVFLVSKWLFVNHHLVITFKDHDISRSRYPTHDRDIPLTIAISHSRSWYPTHDRDIPLMIVISHSHTWCPTQINWQQLCFSRCVFQISAWNVQGQKLLVLSQTIQQKGRFNSQISENVVCPACAIFNWTELFLFPPGSCL